jgi:hypothetical protein
MLPGFFPGLTNILCKFLCFQSENPRANKETSFPGCLESESRFPLP